MPVEERVEAIEERYDRRVDRLREELRRRIARLRRDEKAKIEAIRQGAQELSQNGVEFIASWEGLRLTAYKAHPSEPYWTIGYGHYGSDVRQGQTITKAQALDYLRSDTRLAEGAVLRLITVRLNQNQFDALVSFTFNCGVGALEGSTLRRVLNEGRYAQVPSELMRWVNAGGVPVEGLVRRRRAEADLWSK